MGQTKTAFIGDIPEEKQKKVKKNDSQVESVTPSEETVVRQKRVRVRGANHKKAISKIDKTKLYSIKEAVSLIKDTSYSKFDGTVELHAMVKKTGLAVQVSLPNSTGSSKKVELADENTIKKLEKGAVDFDVLLATPEMMPKLVPFARILGPKGLMPNPKNGTLIKKTEDAKNFSTDTITVKTEKKAPLVHVALGKVSQDTDKIIENIEAIINAIGPRQIIKANLCATMSPSVKIEIVNTA